MCSFSSSSGTCSTKGKLPSKELCRQNLPAVLVALSNIWGLLLIIIFLSYGVVEVPRLLWRRGHIEKNMRYQEFKTASIHDRMFEASAQLENAVRLIHAASKTVPNSSDLRVYIDILLNKCPPKMLETQSALKTHEDASTLSALGDVKMSKLVSLHHDLKFALASVRTFAHEWELHLKYAFYLQDIITAQEVGTWLITSQINQRSKGCCSRFFYSFEYCYRVHVQQWVYRVMAVVSALASVLLVLGEVTLFIDKPVTGIPLLFTSSSGFTGTQILCLLPLLYVILCTELGLFKIKFSTSRSLYQNQSEAASLVWTAAFIARLVTPLCFNFLLLIKVDHTQFSDVMGVLDLVPALGTQFSIYFPMLIVVFCFANYIKLYGKILNWVRLQQLQFTDSYESEKAQEGMELLLQGKSQIERSARERVVQEPMFQPVSTRFADVFSDVEKQNSATQAVLEAVASSEVPKLKSKYANHEA